MKIDRYSPIGIFDSGLGGLTVQKELMEQLPHENTVYFGDSGRAPYGTKSRETIIHFADQDANFLISQGVKMVVIACNTASSYAYESLSAQLGVPVIEVINPGARAAVRATRNGRIGVIGTAATTSSNVYHDALLRKAQKYIGGVHIKVFQQACPLFVGLAEEGWWDNDVALLTARKYLEPLKEQGVDTLVLGCTHYPLLRDVISHVMGEKVILINSASEVVQTVADQLTVSDLVNDGAAAPSINSFFTSDSVDKFKALGGSFLNKNIESAIKVDIEKY